MKILVLPFLITILLLTPQTVDGQCSYFDIVQPNPFVTNACADPTFSQQFADPTDVPNLPTAGTKQLTAAFSFKILDLCNSKTPFAIYRINVYTGTSFVKIFEVQVNSLTSFTSYITDTIGKQQLLTISTDVVDTWLVGAVSFDLAANKVVQTWMTATDYSTITTSNLNFGTWIFKKNGAAPYFFNFANDNETPSRSASGENQLIVFGYSFETNLFPYLFGTLAPIRLGSYSMLENTGWKLNDAAVTIGAAYFGSSTAAIYDATYAPSWSISGVVFTSRTQYIKMPSTPFFKTANPLVPASASLTFMIRLDEIFVGSVFTRVSTTSVTVMALNVNAYGKLQAVLGDTILSMSKTALPLKQWVQVTVFYMFSKGRALGAIYFDTTLVTPGLDSAPLIPLSSFTESNTDIFKIGGFKGSMRNLGIYGPGAARLLTSKCASCSWDLGATTAACVRPACTSTQYISGQSCQACYGTTGAPVAGACQTCINAGANACMSCPATKTLTETNSCVASPTPSTPASTPTTPSTTTTETKTSQTDTGVPVEIGTGFDVDVIVAISVSSISVIGFVVLVIKIAKKKALENALHQAVPSSPPKEETNIREESLY